MDASSSCTSLGYMKQMPAIISRNIRPVHRTVSGVQTTIQLAAQGGDIDMLGLLLGRGASTAYGCEQREQKSIRGCNREWQLFVSREIVRVLKVGQGSGLLYQSCSCKIKRGISLKRKKKMSCILFLSPSSIQATYVSTYHSSSSLQFGPYNKSPHPLILFTAIICFQQILYQLTLCPFFLSSPLWTSRAEIRQPRNCLPINPINLVLNNHAISTLCINMSAG